MMHPLAFGFGAGSVQAWALDGERCQTGLLRPFAMTGAAGSYGDLLVTSIVVLAIVGIVAFVVVRVVGRFLATGRVRGAHLLDVIARVPLEPRRSLYVVEVAGKTLLLGTSEMGLNVISELDGAEVRARTVPRQSFGDLVRAAWGRRKPGGAAEAASEKPVGEEPPS